jgi:serine/threonine protein kinase
MAVDGWATERRRQIEELFDAALGEPPERRSDFLLRAVPDNPELRAEVESLLSALKNERFLESSPLHGLVEKQPSLKPGERLAHFEISGLLGRGGMGEVYRARDLRLRRDVAIKTLPFGFATDSERVSRFEREARTASTLNHPHIVSVFDIGHENGIYWIVSELVDGESLSTLISRGPLSPRRVIELGTQIADGLATAHGAGIVHRDLKPGNIMVRKDGCVKIVDFGLAKQQNVNAGSTTEVSSPGVVFGTVEYMSPEQIRGGKLDSRSDIFSLGAILFEMISGKRPFSGSSSVEVMNAILTEEVPELPASAPPQLANLIHHCLEKDPGRRFQSAADLGFVLSSSSVSAGVEPLPTRRNRRWMWPCLALILFASGVLPWLMTHQRQASDNPKVIFRRLTNDRGLTTDGMISPDGKLVAYASDRADPTNLDIYVQQIGSGKVFRLTDDPADDSAPDFSADSSRLAFRSERLGGGIYEVSTMGGEVRLLVPGGEQPRYSPDGRYLLYSYGERGRYEQGGLTSSFVQALEGGPPVLISRGCDRVWASGVWSPDSSHIIFWGRCGGNWSAWLTRTDGTLPQALKNSQTFLFEQNVNEIEGWLANPSRLLVAVWQGDALVEATQPIALDGTFLGPQQRLIFGPIRHRHASASPTGRIVFSNFEQSSNVWRLRTDANGSAVGAPTAMIAELVESTYDPFLSKDERLMTVVIDGSRLELFDLKAGTQRTITQNFQGGDPILSPDGGGIVYVTDAGAKTLATEVGFPDTILPGDLDVTDWSAQNEILTRDGKSGSIKIFTRRTGKYELYLADPKSLLFQAHFSHDDQWVAFTSVRDQHSRIYVVPFRRSMVPKDNWTAITDGSHWDAKPRFSTDDKTVFFISDRDGHRCIWAQPLSSEMRPQGHPVAVYHSHYARRSLGLTSLDALELGVGRDFIIFNQDERTGNIWLMEPKTTGQN